MSRLEKRVERLEGGGGSGEAHGNYRHGGRTREVEEVRKLANLLARLSDVIPE